MTSWFAVLVNPMGFFHFCETSEQWKQGECDGHLGRGEFSVWERANVQKGLKLSCMKRNIRGVCFAALYFFKSLMKTRLRSILSIHVEEPRNFSHAGVISRDLLRIISNGNNLLGFEEVLDTLIYVGVV